MFEFENISIQDNNCAVFNIPPSLTKRGILDWYNNSMRFPYFGFNWDSLYDALCDLSWISEKHIRIIHSGLPDLSEDDLLVYIRILWDVISSWKHDETHVLHAHFPVSSEIKLNNLVKYF